MDGTSHVREGIGLVLSALAGITVTGVYGALNWPASLAQTANMIPQDAQLAAMPVILETCCIFFSTIYFVGRWLSLHLNGHTAAARFHAGGRSQVRIVQILSGTFVVLRQTLFRPEGQPFAWQNVATLALGLAFVVASSFLRDLPDWRTVFS